MQDAATAAPVVTASLSSFIEQLAEIRAALSDLRKQEKELDARKREVEQHFIEALDAVGTDTARNKALGFTASISESVVPTIEDYDSFLDFVRSEDAWYLFTRHLSSPAYRELLADREGADIPGLKPFTKRSISLRKLA